MSWGEIYNTSWWGVALDTARTVKARPDFFGSQLNLLTSEQPNLVTNGTFDTDSNWVKGTGWSISGGKAVKTSGTSSILFQSNIVESDKSYKLTFDVIRNSGFITSVFLGGVSDNTDIDESGTYTYYITSINQDVLGFNADSTFNGSIDNVSVKVARAELDQIEAKKCLADWIHTTALKDLNN